MIPGHGVQRLAFSICFGISLTCAAGSSLLLDFGPTAVAPADAMLDMGHFSGAVPGAEISWNTVVNANNSSLVYSDGTAASGVSVIVGRSDYGAGNAIDFNNKLISSSALGSQLIAGIYTNTSPLKDGIFATGTSTVLTNALGIRIDGLAAGTYTLYISGRNTSTAVTASELFFATNGPAASSFSFSTNTTPSTLEVNSAAPIGSAPNPALAITGTFAYGDNCVSLVVNLNAGESVYLAATGVTNECRGFLNAVAIAPGLPVLTNFPATVGVQPANATVYGGATVTIGNVKYGGVPPLYYQWYFDGVALTGATNSTLTLSNVTAGMAGNYNVSVQNVIATNYSSNAVVTIIPLFNTAQMTNIWNILPGNTNHPYITTTAGGERGLAFNPVTTNLLVLTHVPTNNLVALDPATGNRRYLMNVAGIATNSAGMNMVGVAGDGAVYAGNVVANASSASTPYLLWQWVNDGSNTVPQLLFEGDPGFGTVAAGLRWGDNIAVCGAGSGTEILIAPGAEATGNGTNVVLFTTQDGLNFSQMVIGIYGVPSGFGQGGIAFGPVTNTFWAKNTGQQLYLVQFDPVAATGSVLYACGPSNGVPNSFQFISVNGSQNWLAGVMSVASGQPDNVRLYDIFNLTNGPVLADQELNLTANGNGFNNGVGVGSTAFGGNYLFSLDSQNGVRAFLISTNPAPFSITGINSQAGPNVALSWQSLPGFTYQVQTAGSLLNPGWANVGPSIMAYGTNASASVSASGTNQFYRVQGL